jgi:hypothetical protein
MVTTMNTLISPDQERTRQRRQVLLDHGANDQELLELLAYNHNIFSHEPGNNLEPEPHVSTWQKYISEAVEVGVWESLRRRLVQLQYPIKLGISETADYQASTRRGLPVPLETVGLKLRSPQQLELFMHDSWAGPIPVIFAGDRSDFELLVQALLRRNEPVAIPAAMGACMVAGFNNWDRIRSYRNHWELEHSSADWEQEWRHLIPQKALYQDRFMLLSDSPYSNVGAADLGLPEDDWQRQSRTIRLEHESIHYWTKRRLGAMQNNILDELMADYWGLVVATGEYRADWFLRFLGLEAWPSYRSNGRLSSYRGQPELSAGAFRVLQGLVVNAAQNLERAHRSICQKSTLTVLENARGMVEALSYLTLEEIASAGLMELLTELGQDLQTKQLGRI